MKKQFQLFIVIVVFPLFMHAQYVEANWQVEDNTTKVNGVNDIQNNFTTYMLNQYTLIPINDILEIVFTNKDYPSNYEGIFCKTISWSGTSSNYFTKDLQGNPQDHKIAEGTTIDFTNPLNRIVSFEVQADKTTMFYPNLVDINGKISNANFMVWYTLPVTGGIDLQDETKWTKITFAWNDAITADAKCSTMEDRFSVIWLERDNSNTNLDRVPLDSTRIAGVVLTIDPSDTGILNEKKTMYIRNFTIGNPILKNIKNQQLTKQSKSVVIDLEEYYGGNGTPIFNAQLVSGNNVTITQSNSQFTITANNICADFTNTIEFTISDANGVFSQNVDILFESNQIEAPSIGVVTVDSTGSYLQIAWERPNVDYIDTYKIYREGLADVYQEKGEWPYESISVFVDVTAFVNNRSYRYKLSAVDICGQESEKSTPHNSIHLRKTLLNNKLDLEWSQYEGAQVLGYRLTEGYSFDNMTKIDEFSQLTYTIYNPGNKLYRIETIMADTISPKILKSETGPFILAMSNIAESETSISQINSNEFKVYSTTDQQLLFEYNGISYENYIVSIYSNTGQLVDEKYYSNTLGFQGNYNGLAGVYTVSISNGKNILSKQIVIK